MGNGKYNQRISISLTYPETDEDETKFMRLLSEVVTIQQEYIKAICREFCVSNRYRFPTDYWKTGVKPYTKPGENQKYFVAPSSVIRPVLEMTYVNFGSKVKVIAESLGVTADGCKRFYQHIIKNHKKYLPTWNSDSSYLPVKCYSGMTEDLYIGRYFTLSKFGRLLVSDDAYVSKSLLCLYATDFYAGYLNFDILQKRMILQLRFRTEEAWAKYKSEKSRQLITPEGFLILCKSEECRKEITTLKRKREWLNKCKNGGN